MESACQSLTVENEPKCQIIHTFAIDETEIGSDDTTNPAIKTFNYSPKRSNSRSSNHFSYSNLGELRVILRKDDGWLDPSSPRALSVDHRAAFKFETYKDEITGVEFLVSVCISEIPIADSSFLKSLWSISLIKIIEPQRHYPYDFNRAFFGWSMIVFPFICFVRGLSVIKHKYLYAKISHLTQSSGYGKTRLCFEYLKYEGCGIYCVFRKGIDTGYPKTTPWLESLVEAFLKSDSDEKSVDMCLSFIYWAIKNFSKLDKEHFKYFLSEQAIPSDLVFQFSSNPSSKQPLPRKFFTIIIDECQEFLITPTDHPELISLYRAFKRAMSQIKDSPVVTVFLGTKSSLGDFVLSGHYKPSFRKEIAAPDEVFDVPVYLFTHACNSMTTVPRNVSFQTAATFKVIDGVALPRSLVMQNIAWDCGRPLWRQYDSFLNAFDCAKLKLTGDKEIKELASLILRTGSSVVPQDQLAHQLVLSGMATLTYVDVDGSRCYMEYIPEPLLSNNARLLLNQKSAFVKSLKDYIKRLELGVFHESGEAGEQVARIVLLRMLDLISLYPKRTGLPPDLLSSVKFIMADQLIGSSDNYTESAASFANRLDFIHGKSNVSWAQAESPIVERDPAPVAEEVSSRAATSDNGRNLMFLTPNIAVSTVRQFILLASNGEFDDDLGNFGVSDQVLDGLLSVNQFVKLENPMHIDQVFLMQGFARGCAFILADRAPGGDLVFPVLRTDNKMSCIVFQIKNLSSNTFPDRVAKVSSKLSHKVLNNFLDFGAVGDFGAAPSDDFVRVVIQFGCEDVHAKGEIYFWSKIPMSKSCINPGQPCHALWLYGLDALSHIFFGDLEILTLLDRILSGRRDFYRHLSYPRYPLPTYLQSTEQGARFLGRLARPFASHSNLNTFDAQLRQTPSEVAKCELKILEEEMKLLQLPERPFEYLESCKYSPQVQETATASFTTSIINAAEVSAPVLNDLEMEIIDTIVTCNGFDSLSDELQRYSNCFNQFTAEVKAQCEIVDKMQKSKLKLNKEIINRISLIMQKAEQEALISMEELPMDVETDIVAEGIGISSMEVG